MKKVKSIEWVNGTIGIFEDEHKGFKAAITWGIPMPNANEIVEIHAAEQKERVEVNADSLLDLEDQCQKIIRKKEGLEDYVSILGWRVVYQDENYING